MLSKQHHHPPPCRDPHLRHINILPEGQGISVDYRFKLTHLNHVIPEYVGFLSLKYELEYASSYTPETHQLRQQQS